jgi:RNA polymerase sigma-70 factor (ECF subfamily)
MSSEDEKETTVQAALRQESGPMTGSELERAYREHHLQVIQAAYRVTGSAADAEDVLQTVFLRLLRHPHLPNKSPQLGSYLHRAAVNASIDLLRSRKSRKDISIEKVQPRQVQSLEAGPEDLQTARELATWLRRAVSELSPQTAEIFALRYFEGYSNQEVAELVDTSPGVVAVVLHRARNRLREGLRSFSGGAS